MNAIAVVDIPTIECFLNEIPIFFSTFIDYNSIDESVRVEWKVVNN